MAHVTKRTTKAGEARYDVEWRLPDGKVHTKTFNRRKDADAFRSTLEADRLRGVVVDPRRTRIAFEAIARHWLAAGTTKRSTSVARDRAIIERHLVPTLGERMVGSITKADVQALVDSWSATKAPSTVGRQYSCLRAIFAYAESDERIVRSPCRGIRLPRVRLVDRPYLDTDQLATLAQALGPDQGTMMWLGAVLGLRWSEAAGLTVDRLDLLAGAITVDRQLARTGELVPPKSNAGIRTLACPQWLVDQLAALLTRRGLTAADGSALVLVGEGGKPLDYTNWRRRTWVPTCERAGLPGLRFHDLRSLAATALVAAGVDMKTAQTRLGHSSPQVTLGLYARATVAADRKAADAVGAMFAPRDSRGMDSPGRKGSGVTNPA